MDSYQDIKVLADPEFNENTLMAALFAKLHRALSAREKGDIGVSFPEFSVTPGAVIRLHGSRSSLAELDATRWRAGLSDYCEASLIAPIPNEVKWRCVRRVQVKSNPQRLLRRSVRKGWLTEEQAEQRSSEIKVNRSNLPFLSLKSLSSGQHFRLFILQGELQPEPVNGTFSSYGLSDKTTVPWF